MNNFPSIRVCACGCGQPMNRSGYVQGHFPRRSAIPAWSAHPSEYRTYHSAKNRCRNPKNEDFKDYGARGIQFRFTSFDHFFAELGPRPAGMSLDRRDNNGHYEPGNVRWASPKEQVENRRTSRKKKEAI